MSPATPSSQLVLPRIHCSARLGHSDDEAAQPQAVLVALALAFDQPPIAVDTDDLADTVDYAPLTDMVVAVSASRRFHLLESLAQAIRQALVPALGRGAHLWVEVAKAESPIPIMNPSASFAIGSPPAPSMLAHRHGADPRLGGPCGRPSRMPDLFHHIGLRSESPDRLIAFYEAALEPLGCRRRVSYESGAGFGACGGTLFWVGGTSLWIGTAPGRSNVHLALSCRDPAMVDAFFEAALRAGGTDNGRPGLRPAYHPSYYAGFVLDPDGNNLEALCLTAL